MMTVFKKLWFWCLLVWFDFFATLSLFPGVTSTIRSVYQTTELPAAPNGFLPGS